MVPSKGYDRIRYKKIYKKALFVDEFIDTYNKVRKRSNFPHKLVLDLVRQLFPGTKFLGRGVLKTAHGITSGTNSLVLKISNRQTIADDMMVYNALPAKVRDRYFATIYWHTRHCLLQKRGRKVNVDSKDLLRIRKALSRYFDGKPYYITDIKPANIRKADGQVKLVDANIKSRKSRKLWHVKLENGSFPAQRRDVSVG